jgi:Ecdysteroid kinase-like family
VKFRPAYPCPKPGDMALPSTIEDISAAWVTKALSLKYPGVVVAGCRIIKVIHGTTTKIRLGLSYKDFGGSDTLPPTMILKGGFEAHRVPARDMYVNEVLFYRDVAPNITINAPKAYYAGVDWDQPQSLILMEDLEVKHVTFCHPLFPHKYAQVSRRLEAMAVYHSQTWNSPELKAGGKMEDVLGRFEGWFNVWHGTYLEPATYMAYTREPRGAAVSMRLHDPHWMGRVFEKLREIQDTQDVCLIHGDTHLGNLYEEVDGTPGFFDAQVSRASWSLEVAYHIIAALDVADRPKYEKALLAHYLSSLRTNGVNAPSFPEAWELYLWGAAYGFFIFLINETAFQTEAVNTAYSVRFASALLEHGIPGQS